MILFLIRWWKPLAIAVVLLAAAGVAIKYGNDKYEDGRMDVIREIDQAGDKAREEARDESQKIDRLGDDAVRDRARARMHDAARGR